ncbi:MAG: type II toxin-antitoxin system CcdA family antitoxin [Porticoccaceae bacterium]
MPQKPANVSINSVLLSRAKELKINLSATLETALFLADNDRASGQPGPAGNAGPAGNPVVTATSPHHS